MQSTLSAYCQLMRLDKPIGTLLLLWPTWWALWLAGNPTIPLLLIFTLGVFVMRSAGCVINDYADRNFDSHVARTKQRPLASGKVTRRQAINLFILLIFIAFILVLMLNPLAILLSCFALATAILYPFMKRYTHLPQLVLGIAFSWGIPMAYAASSNQLPLSCWLLFLVNCAWTIAYDTQYAMVDREDDLKIGIKSTAILFGRYDNLIIALLQLLMLAGLIIIGRLEQLSWIYYLALAVVAILFIYQQILTRSRQNSAYFTAFLNNNWVGLLIFLGIILG